MRTKTTTIYITGSITLDRRSKSEYAGGEDTHHFESPSQSDDTGLKCSQFCGLGKLVPVDEDLPCSENSHQYVKMCSNILLYPQ